MTFTKAVIIVSHIPILITVVYAAAIFPKLGRELKVFTWFVFVSGLVQFLSLACWFAGKNNMPLLHFYVAAGFACLAWFYNTVLKGFIDARIIGGVTLLFLLFTVLNTLFIQPLFRFNSYALTVESILVITLSIFTFIILLNDIVKETSGADVKSVNWINSGLFIYYSSSLLIFYFGDTIIHLFSKTFSRYTWVFHSFFSMVMYTFFCIGLWKRSRT
jgi:hypothetical protein